MVSLNISEDQKRVLGFLRMFGPSYYKEIAAKCSAKECSTIPGLRVRGMLIHSYTAEGKVVYKITDLGKSALDALREGSS